jgi:ABC-type nitrate/sulfonate/bicarbonate transport system ATPase subunit
MISLAINVHSKVYPNGVCAIRNLSFNARPGEFVAIVGPSGAGKTTLLSLIAGLDAEMDGDISINAAQSLQRPKVGFMFQEPRLMPWLTVQQNIELVLRPYANTRNAEEDRARLQSLLKLVGLKDFAHMFPSQLSAGMNRRVALLRAFIIEPDLLLMDEPFQSLDAPTAEQLRILLLDLWERTSPTVVFVTHSLHEAISLADRILFLSARPSRVILEYIVPLSRPRALDSASVQQIHHQLLSRHPQLLEGVVAPAQPSAMVGGQVHG